jgi:hypothetical protein
MSAVPALCIPFSFRTHGLKDRRLESLCMPTLITFSQFPLRYASLTLFSLVVTRFLEMFRVVPC